MPQIFAAYLCLPQIFVAYSSMPQIFAAYSVCPGGRYMSHTHVCHNICSKHKCAANICGIHVYDSCIFFWEWKKSENNLLYTHWIQTYRQTPFSMGNLTLSKGSCKWHSSTMRGQTELDRRTDATNALSPSQCYKVYNKPDEMPFLPKISLSMP